MENENSLESTNNGAFRENTNIFSSDRLVAVEQIAAICKSCGLSFAETKKIIGKCLYRLEGGEQLEFAVLQEVILLRKTDAIN